MPWGRQEGRTGAVRIRGSARARHAPFWTISPGNGLAPPPPPLPLPLDLHLREGGGLGPKSLFTKNDTTRLFQG